MSESVGATKVNSKKCDNIEREKEELLSIEMQKRREGGREGIQVEQACGRCFLRHYGKRRARACIIINRQHYSKVCGEVW